MNLTSAKLKRVKPKINLFNRQRNLHVDVNSARQFLESVAEYLGLSSGFSVVLVSDAAMKRLNSTYAGKEQPTDVLSFPAGDTAGDEPYLGDIIVSVETADAQRIVSLNDEVRILCLHGILHLMGYDHEYDDGEMNSREVALRKRFGLQ